MVKRSKLTKKFYRPGEVAEMLSVHTRTIQNYCMRGELGEVFSHTGRRYIPHESLITYLEDKGLLEDDTGKERYDVIYARVSTHKQKKRGDLDRQVDKIKVYISEKNPRNLKVITDVASGLNDNRRGLTNLLKEILDEKVSRVFVEYKDRLTRFGYKYLKIICDYTETELVIISDEEENRSIEEELAEDIISIIHSFSGKLYGLRRKVKEEVTKELEKNDIN